MSVHERAVGVHERARTCMERAWSVRVACVWRAHDMMGVHMTRSFEVIHRRTQLTEVCTKIFFYKILYLGF